MPRTKKISKKRSVWNKIDTEKLKHFILSEKKDLLSNFYLNIKQKDKKCRKLPGFFQRMSLAVGKSSEQCKSKFQKFEANVYCNFLNVPKPHFELFEKLRVQKRIHAKNQASFITLKRKKEKPYQVQLEENLEILRQNIIKEQEENQGTSILNNEEPKNLIENLNDDISEISSKNKFPSTFVSLRNIEKKYDLTENNVEKENTEEPLNDNKKTILDFSFEEEEAKSFNLSVCKKDQNKMCTFTNNQQTIKIFSIDDY